MPKRPKVPVPTGRYSMDRAVIEIAEMRDREGLQDKDIYLSVGISQDAFSRKMANSGRSSFTVEELGRIADYFSERLRRALPGWPLLSDRECRLWEEAMSRRKPTDSH